MTEEPFGYEYFDDPTGHGYRGYRRSHNGDGAYLPWPAARQFCQDHEISTAVDLGCAKGYLVAELIAAGIDTVGYDVSSYALSFAAGLPCYQRDIRLGLPHCVDAVFALGVLLYLDECELGAVLADLHLKTSRFLLISNYYATETQAIVDPLRRITRPKSWWRQAIEHAGFNFDYEGEVFDVYQR